MKKQTNKQKQLNGIAQIMLFMMCENELSERAFEAAYQVRHFSGVFEGKLLS